MAAKKVSFITPLGTAVWPKLDKVDVFQMRDKKGNPKGDPKVRYTCNIKFDDAMTEKVRKHIDALILKHDLDVGDNENSPFKKDKKDDSITLFATSGEKYRPPVFDAKNNRLPEGVIVGGGSKIKLDLTLNAYDGFGGGVNMYINAVQVLELVEPSFGKSNFEAVEDGFEYDGSEEDASTKESSFDKANAKDLDDEIPF